MASVPKTRETSSLEKHLICSICMGVFQNPVTTGCGHTFCKQCLRCNFKYNDRVCPLCKQPQHKTPGVNIIINTLVQQMANPASSDDNIYTGATGEVACDICTEQKLRAEKSCLVCLVSYCSTHLKNHSSISRLKSHKLVEPVKNLDKRACLKHGRPLELYSKKGEQCICVCCMEGDQEEFISTEKESNEKKVSPAVHISFETLMICNWNLGFFFMMTGSDRHNKDGVATKSSETTKTSGGDKCVSKELYSKLHRCQRLLK